MDIEAKAQEAANLKQYCNCCQAVLLALKDETKLSEDELMQLGAGFGLGMGNMEGTCGALVGAAIIAGFNSKLTRADVKKMTEDFKSRVGSIICGDIKGRKTGKVLCSCPDCCKNAVLAYGEIIKNK